MEFITRIKKEGITILLVILPILLLAVVWNKIPATIATHYNISGEPDAYRSKSMLIWFIPVLSIFIYFFLLAIPLIDPKKRIQEMKAKFQVLRLLIQGFFAAFLVLFIITSYQQDASFVHMLIPLTGLFLIIIGNYLQSVKPNYFIGIRTPWTLSDDNNWYKTNKLGGRLFILLGFLLLIGYFIGIRFLQTIFIPLIMLIVLIPIAYSFWIYKTTQKP
jgi:uncharacterized membrane protein